MAANLYPTWLEQLGQLHGSVRITVLRNSAWLLVVFLQSRSVHLSQIAEELPWQVKLPSATRRLSRFLANATVRVCEWCEPVARQLLIEQARSLVRFV